MLITLVKLTRKLRALLMGNKDKEMRWFLFKMHWHMPVEDIRCRLIPYCYQYNPFSVTYKSQVWTCRKLAPDGLHQIHLRFYYENGCTIVTGHYEIDPLILPREHLDGADLRALKAREIQEVQKALLKGP